MSNERGLSHGVMEGKGAYNRHAKIPTGGAALAAPFLEKAARNLALDPGARSVVIADYGSSQGKNSLGPLRMAIQALQPRLSPNRAIFVFHIDQASNDFNSLFEVLSSDPDRYGLDGANIFPCAIGRSFYEQVLPLESVDLGWCSYAAVWLSCIPSLIPGHFFPPSSTGAAQAAFERQGAADWETFLSLRAIEMRPGARLVVVLPGLSDDGLSGFEALMDHANAVLAAMVDEGAFTAEERAGMILGGYLRRKSELLAPFTKQSEFQRLVVEDCEISALPDAAWADYQRNIDKEALATKQTLFFRSVFMPSLASALNQVRSGDAEALRCFADRLQDGLKQRLVRHPTPLHSFVETIVLAKCV